MSSNGKIAFKYTHKNNSHNKENLDLTLSTVPLPINERLPNQAQLTTHYSLISVNLFDNFLLVPLLLLRDVQSASTLRIMPMGDALTTGFNGAQGGYRPRIFSKLTNNG